MLKLWLFECPRQQILHVIIIQNFDYLICNVNVYIYLLLSYFIVPKDYNINTCGSKTSKLKVLQYKASLVCLKTFNSKCLNLLSL